MCGVSGGSLRCSGDGAGRSPDRGTDRALSYPAADRRDARVQTAPIIWPPGQAGFRVGISCSSATSGRCGGGATAGLVLGG